MRVLRVAGFLPQRVQRMSNANAKWNAEGGEEHRLQKEKSNRKEDKYGFNFL